MANTIKSIVTRIKNKVDTLDAWQNYTGTLLDGEIAIIRVATGETYINPVTSQEEPVVELLMKVGDGSSPFAQLPWLSAKASDVYGWAKLQDASDIPVKFNAGTTAEPSLQDVTLQDVLDKITDHNDRIVELEADVAALSGSVLSSLSVSAPVTAGVVQGITYSNGVFTVSYDTVKTTDIENAAITTAKIDNDSVTDEKIVTVSASKVEVTPKNGSTAAVMLPAKITAIEADISSKAAATHTHGNVSNTGTITSTAVTAATGVLVYDANNKIQRATAANARSIIGAASSGHNHSGTYSPVGHNHDGNYVKHDAAQALADTNKTTARTNIGAASQKDLEDLAADVSELTESVSKGVNFRGEVSTAPSGTTYTLTGTTTPVTALVGDMVIKGDKEYIYTANSTWKELGDLSRVTTLENAHKNVVTAGTYTKVTVGANGHVTGGSSPTTLAGFGITDAYTKADVYTKAEVNSELAKKSDTGHSHSLSITAGAEDDGVVELVGTAGTNGVSYAVSHADSAVSAGTYKSVTVDAKGHVTAGTNPTTLAGFGITDAYKKSDVYTKTEVNSELAKKSDTSHTHAYLPDTTKYAGSSSQGGAATSANKVNKSLVIKLNSGSTEGTNLFTFNGSAAKTINVTPSAIGAATSGHTHPTYEGSISDLQSKAAHISTASVTVNGAATTKNVLRNGNATNADILIFDCGGAWDL